ncbi:type II secretion system protein GspM [Xylophilus sp. ASV27]|uniref:type II secretion system protein GspM n=1 Tax=Xylophilus sp. ASV27 TaxID=2795129 RepID=UPI0018ED7A7C|nr:type II secretion system protein GspM [Xylophilus sp. ASV27]
MTLYLRRQDRVALACLGLLLLLPVAVGVYFVASKHVEFAGRIEQIEPRYARLLGLEAAKPKLEAAQASVRATLEKFTYPAAQDATQAGNDAQQKIRAVLTAAKLDISSSQVLAPKADGDMERIPISVRAEGDLLALQAALVGLGSQTPAILIDRMNIQASSYQRPEASRLMVQFSFYVLRARS